MADYFYNYVIGGPYVGSLTQAMRNGNFYLTTVICVIILMLPVLSYRFYHLDVHPSLSDKIRYKRKMAQIKSRQSNDTLRTPSARRARRSLRSGYAFAHQVQSIQMYVTFSPVIIANSHFRKDSVGSSHPARLCESFRRTLHFH